MKIVADSHYMIGKTHLVCEDYAHHFDNKMVVCDGCSSSENTDIGARLLALSFDKVIDVCFESFDEDESLYTTIAKELSLEMQQITASLWIPVSSMDASLIGAFIDPSTGLLRVIMYGDGSIIYKKKDEDFIRAVNVSYEKEAPYYLSYLHAGLRKDNYIEFANQYEDGKIKTIKSGNISDLQEYKQRYDFPIYYMFHPEELEFLALVSDGLTSFYEKGECGLREPVDFNRVIMEFTSFPIITPGFVKRRMRRACEVFEKKNIFHSDDISMAVMYFTE